MSTQQHGSLQQAALEYAALGWKVTPLHAPMPKGGCTCSKGQDCPSAGKHPRLKDWQKLASSDEKQVLSWWEKHPGSNIGVTLGQASGIIDIECDTPEAEQDLQRLFDGEPLVCPTFQSHRGKHRIFQWRPDLPGGACVHIGGVEIRTGNGDKGAQSVFPPSVSAEGAPRIWLVSPEEVAPPALPQQVVVKLWNLDGEKTTPEKKSSKRQNLYTQPEISEGQRDETIYAEACAMWRLQFKAYGKECFDDPQAQSEIYKRLWMCNKAKCQPPLADDVVLQKCEGGRSFIQKETTNEKDKEGPKLTALGLEFQNDEWWPGAWHVDSINSDPPIAKLYAPFLAKPIELTMEQYDSSMEVHRSILGATGCVCLDDGVLPWREIWKGHKTRGKKRTKRGLFAKLLDTATKIDAPIEVKRQNIVATFLLSQLKKAKPLEEGKNPGTYVKAFLRNGCTIFLFEAIRQEMEFSPDKITRHELSKLCHELKVKDQRELVGEPGQRTRFMLMDKKHYLKLQDMVCGEQKKGTCIEGKKMIVSIV